MSQFHPFERIYYDRRIHLVHILKTLIPRVHYTVTERDGQPELVVWKMWLGSAYDIVSLAGSWGRWDRHRIAAGAPSSGNLPTDGDQ